MTSSNVADASHAHDTNWAAVIQGSVLFLSIVAAAQLRRLKVKYFHESAAAVTIGAIFGLVLWLAAGDSMASIIGMLSFNTDVFFLVLLPPIIFHAGYNINLRLFFANLGSITGFAVLGTIISTVLMTLLVYSLGAWGIIHELPIIDAVLFGTLISAVDPVSVISIFESLHCDRTLHSLVFGESVLNDAVVIVIFNTFKSLSHATFDGMFLLSAFGSFVGIFVGSMAMGIVFGLLSSLFFKFARMKEYPVFESAIVLLLAYVPYIIAEAVTMSGIVTLLFTGITMSHYSFFNLSRQSREQTRQLFHVLANTAETFVFGYLGLAVFVISGHEYKIGLILVSIFGCLVTRAIHVFPLSSLLNLGRGNSSKITPRNQVIIWWGGLRGAIAFALSIAVTGENAHPIVTTTLCTVAFSVFVLGGSTPWFVKKLKIVIEPPDDEFKMHLPDDSNEEAGKDGRGRGHVRDKLAVKWSSFDSRYLKPLFTKITFEGGRRAAERILKRSHRSAHTERRTTTGLASGTYIGSTNSIASLCLEDATTADGLFRSSAEHNHNHNLAFGGHLNPVSEYIEQLRSIAPLPSGEIPRNISFLSVVNAADQPHAHQGGHGYGYHQHAHAHGYTSSNNSPTPMSSRRSIGNMQMQRTHSNIPLNEIQSTNSLSSMGSRSLSFNHVPSLNVLPSAGSRPPIVPHTHSTRTSAGPPVGPVTISGSGSNFHGDDHGHSSSSSSRSHPGHVSISLRAINATGSEGEDEGEGEGEESAE